MSPRKRKKELAVVARAFPPAESKKENTCNKNNKRVPVPEVKTTTTLQPVTTP